jgi:hypothetical protein
MVAKVFTKFDALLDMGAWSMPLYDMTVHLLLLGTAPRFESFILLLLSYRKHGCFCKKSSRLHDKLSPLSNKHDWKLRVKSVYVHFLLSRVILLTSMKVGPGF